MSERPVGYWERRATFPATLRTEAAIFLVSLVGAVASVPARQYLAGALFAVLALAEACILWAHASVGYGHAYDYGWMQGVNHAAAEAEAAGRPCEIAIDRTDPPEGHGFLYVLKFSTGTVKVGQTGDPRRRMAEHRRDAAAYGVTIVDCWISAPHASHLRNEIDLIAVCEEANAPVRREYFPGADFDSIAGLAAGLVAGLVRVEVAR